MKPEPIRLTYADFAAPPDDGKRYEIIDGDLFAHQSPETAHQRVLMELVCSLSEHVDQHALEEVFVGRFDVLLGEHDIVEPDIIFVSTANQEIVTEEHIRGVPDLMIEVVSQSRPEYDTRDKRNQYARCGVPFYWIVDPKKRSVLELELQG